MSLHSLRPKLPPLLTALLALACVPAAVVLGFTPGNLLVLRVGASGSPLAPPNSPPVAAAVFLDELNPAFALGQGPVQSIAAPGVTLTNNDYVLGALSLAADGASAVFGGVGATAGTSAIGYRATLVVPAGTAIAVRATSIGNTSKARATPATVPVARRWDA